MKINGDNYELGNKAMASVLLLYYHMISEGGFTNDQTIYSYSVGVDLSSLVDAFCDEGESEIDASLIREGAVIAMICDLDDVMSEYSDDYMKQPMTKKIINILRSRKLGAVPEADELINMVEAGSSCVNQINYNSLLASIYRKYVLTRWNELSKKTIS